MFQTNQDCASVSLKGLFPRAKFFGAENIYCQSCCSDINELKRGDIFVPLVDSAGDGHGDVAKAVARGASAILAERFIVADVPVCLVKDNRIAYSLLCQALVDNPSDSMQVIGVTGTNGKTTTAHLIQSILNEAKIKNGLLSSLTSFDGYCHSPPNSDSFKAPQLASQLREMRTNGCKVAIVEASSQQLAQHVYSGVHLDAAILTNVRKAHLDFHLNAKNYRSAKSRILQMLKPDGFAVVNADDPISYQMLDRLNVPTMTIAMREDAEVTAKVVERNPGEQTFLILAGDESIPVRTSLMGDHNVRNCLIAAAFGLVLEIDLTTIVRGIEKASRIPGRLETVCAGQDFGVYVDAANTADQLACTIKALEEVHPGRIICVYGSDNFDDYSELPWAGRVLERNVDVPILTSGGLGSHDDHEMMHGLMDGFEDPSKAHMIPTRDSAIRWAIDHAEPGDCVLIAGFGERKRAGSKNHRVSGLSTDKAICKSQLLSPVDYQEALLDDEQEPEIYRFEDYLHLRR